MITFQLAFARLLITSDFDQIQSRTYNVEAILNFSNTQSPIVDCFFSLVHFVGSLTSVRLSHIVAIGWQQCQLTLLLPVSLVEERVNSLVQKMALVLTQILQKDVVGEIQSVLDWFDLFFEASQILGIEAVSWVS